MIPLGIHVGHCWTANLGEFRARISGVEGKKIEGRFGSLFSAELLVPRDGIRLTFVDDPLSQSGRGSIYLKASLKDARCLLISSM